MTKMRLLELFAGTGSIGRSFREQGWEVVSLDIDPKCGACITADFMAWDWTVYEPGHFDAVWASPVCTMYSVARTTAKTPRDLEGSDRMVGRVLECIRYFGPKVYAFENPATGLLKTRPVVQGLPFKDISYCMYGFPYRKATRIWTNCEAWTPRPICTKQAPCVWVENGHHPMTAQRAPGKKDGVRDKRDKCSVDQLYSMPKGLCDELAKAFKGS
jgi:hypothetical protein